MTQAPDRQSRRAAVRAVAITGLSLIAAIITWRLRPTTRIDTTTAESAIVAGCAWLAWALAGYLAIATAAVSLGHLAGGLGLVGRALRRIAPAQLRRAIDAAVATGVAVTIVGTAGVSSAVAAPPPAAVSQRPPLIAGSPLDWPGLTVSGLPSSHHDDPTHHHDPPRHHRPPADVGLVGGRHAGAGDVVVAPGDTLWSIAARSLGPGASGAAITIAWHDWYQANHDVIGSNPSVIHPGQHLVAPKGRTS